MSKWQLFARESVTAMLVEIANSHHLGIKKIHSAGHCTDKKSARKT